MTRRAAEIALLTGFLILAVLLYRSTAAYPEVVQNSTAAYVRFLGICLGVLCGLELLLRIKKQSQEPGKKLELASSPLRFWGLLIIMFLYAMLLEPLGFYLASALFLPLTMFMLGARKKLQVILTSAGVLLFVYLVFAKLLSVPLPQSSLF
jgi:putative tricarboxylic transport membrane protein